MTVYLGTGQKRAEGSIPAEAVPGRIRDLMETDHGRRLHPSIAGLQIGSTVAHRDGRVIGQVDSVTASAYWHAIVSWVPPEGDQPTARTDARGRRAQVFSLDGLMVVADV